MDSWAWSDHLAPWLACRVELPVGPLFCVIDGPTRGRPWSATAARGELRRYAAAAGFRCRFAPHQLRHAHAVELARERVPLPVIQRQLGHSYVSTTSVYLQGIDVEEIIGTIHARRAPMMHVSAGLELSRRPERQAGSPRRRSRHPERLRERSRSVQFCGSATSSRSRRRSSSNREAPSVASRSAASFRTSGEVLQTTTRGARSTARRSANRQFCSSRQLHRWWLRPPMSRARRWSPTIVESVP